VRPVAVTKSPRRHWFQAITPASTPQNELGAGGELFEKAQSEFAEAYNRKDVAAMAAVFTIIASDVLSRAWKAALFSTPQNGKPNSVTARNQLPPVWSQSTAADKASFVGETSMEGTPSYVELLTGLEMARDVKPR